MVERTGSRIYSRIERPVQSTREQVIQEVRLIKTENFSNVTSFSKALCVRLSTASQWIHQNAPSPEGAGIILERIQMSEQRTQSFIEAFCAYRAALAKRDELGLNADPYRRGVTHTEAARICGMSYNMVRYRMDVLGIDDRYIKPWQLRQIKKYKPKK